MGELVAATPSEPQGADREGSAERSGERSREPTNRNRIRGEAVQGERACNREALAIKGRRRRSGGCAVKATNPYLGRSRLTPERATPRGGARSQQRPYERRGSQDQGWPPPTGVPQARASAKGRTSRRAGRP